MNLDPHGTARRSDLRSPGRAEIVRVVAIEMPLQTQRNPAAAVAAMRDLVLECRNARFPPAGNGGNAVVLAADAIDRRCDLAKVGIGFAIAFDNRAGPL